MPSALRVDVYAIPRGVPELNESRRWRCGCAPGESVLVGQKLSLGAVTHSPVPTAIVRWHESRFSADGAIQP